MRLIHIDSRSFLKYFRDQSSRISLFPIKIDLLIDKTIEEMFIFQFAIDTVFERMLIIYIEYFFYLGKKMP